jgi:hypothetical protein
MGKIADSVQVNIDIDKTQLDEALEVTEKLKETLMLINKLAAESVDILANAYRSIGQTVYKMETTTDEKSINRD